MADIARIVDEVRGFLLAYDQSMKPYVPDLAKDYAAFCVEVNKRLAKCQRLLQQGLRAEAIHLAKEAPDLLDAIQALDFAERPTWLEVVKQYDLPIPPDFDATAIEFLQSAYVDDNPLRELMRSHRRLALQRAPLRDRLDVLRKLAQKDSYNPIWGTDIQAFEMARVEQIKEESAEARRTQDVAGLAILNDELSAKSWSIALPKTLTRTVAQALADFRQHETRQVQTDLVWEMQEAFSALDVHKVREIRTRWQALDGRSGQGSSNPLYGQVEPAFLWLEEIDRQEEEESLYHQAVSDLETGLNDRLPRDDLEELGEAVLRFGRGIPGDLEGRYRSRLDDLSMASSRKRLFLIACVAAVVVLIAILALAISWQWSQSVLARTVAEKVNKSLASQRPDEARAFLDKVAKGRPLLALYPAFAAAKGRLVAAEAAEAERSSRFDQAFRRSEQAPIRATESPLLGLVSSQARTEGEKRRVRELARSRRKAYRDLVARNDQEARPALEALAQKLEEMNEQLANPGAEDAVRSKLRDVVFGLLTASAQVEHVSEEVHALYQSTTSRSDEIRKQLTLRERYRDMDQQLTRAIVRSATMAEDYADALAEAVKVMPEPKSTDLKKVLDEKPYWAGALAAANLAHSWQLEASRSEQPSVAQARAGQSTSLQAQYPRSPDHDLVEEARKHYEAIARRTEGSPSLRKKLNDLFSDYLIADVFTTIVREPLGEFLYYSKTPLNSSTRQVPRLDGLRETEAHNLFPMERNVRFQNKSPQTLLAAELKGVLAKSPTLEGWVPMMVRFASLVSQDAGIDPLLKLSILQFLLPIGGEGSRELAKALEPSIRAIGAAQAFRDARWMNPRDAVANEARPKARKLLDTLPPWEGVRRAAEENERSFVEMVNAIPQPIGWLGRDSTWVCRVGVASRLPPAGEVCVPCPGEPHGIWKVVGRVQGGRAEVTSEDADAMVEGRLVFVRAEPTRP